MISKDVLSCVGASISRLFQAVKIFGVLFGACDKSISKIVFAIATDCIAIN
jgi:hypothetical protein